jgi:hypothetical protein
MSQITNKTRPGGSTTQVQYNKAGAFAGDSELVFNDTTKTLTTRNVALSGTAPRLTASETDAAADKKNWLVEFQSGQIRISSVTDALVENQFFVVNRTAGIVTVCEFSTAIKASRWLQADDSSGFAVTSAQSFFPAIEAQLANGAPTIGALLGGMYVFGNSLTPEGVIVLANEDFSYIGAIGMPTSASSINSLTVCGTNLRLGVPNSDGFNIIAPGTTETIELGGPQGNNSGDERGGRLLWFHGDTDTGETLMGSTFVNKNRDFCISDSSGASSPTDAGAYAVNFSSGKVSQYEAIATVSKGVAPIYAQVNLTAQSAAIGATTIYAVPAAGAGQYRINFVAKVTRAGSVSSTLGGTNGFRIIYTDQDDSVVTTTGNITNLSGSTLAGNTTQIVYSGFFFANCKASTNLQYSFDYLSAGATTMQFNLHIRVEGL